MKTKNLIFFFICIFLGNQLFAREKSVEVFLTNYFETENYKIEKYINEKNTLFFAYYSHDNTDIFQKALFFEVKDNGILPLLFFTKNEVFNSTEKIIALEIKTQTFFGWKAIVGVKKDTFNVSTSFYTDEGKHVTEGIILKLENNKFERIIQNTVEF